MTPPKCTTCRFFEEFDFQPRAGVCRLKPPVVIADSGASTEWPRVETGDWCGEHVSAVELRGDS